MVMKKKPNATDEKLKKNQYDLIRFQKKLDRKFSQKKG